jgi:flagellum-specific peptidoglycan hydrolase FlgJ
MTLTAFVNMYGRYAQPAKQHGIFPAVSIAAAYIESNRPGGISTLASKYNNFHGIQKYPKWKGQTVKLMDNNLRVMREFCVYPSIQAGFNGFVKFLQDNPRYGRAGVFSATTPGQQVKLIGGAGYSETGTWSAMVNKAAAMYKSGHQAPGNISFITPVIFTVIFLVLVLSDEK